MIRIGKRIAAAREYNNMTQTELAKLCRISPSYISAIETERIIPGFGVLKYIARSMNMSMKVLIGAKDKEECEHMIYTLKLNQTLENFTDNEQKQFYTILNIIKDSFMPYKISAMIDLEKINMDEKWIEKINGFLVELSSTQVKRLYRMANSMHRMRES